MDAFAALVLGAIVAEESLRFSSVFEQEAEASCGLAAASSLFRLYCGRPGADEAALALVLAEARDAPASAAGGPPGSLPAGAGASIADLALLASEAGLRTRAFRLDQGGLAAAARSGLVPAILHYDRPRGHFALLLGVSPGLPAGQAGQAPALGDAGDGGAGTVFVVADPARGTECLDSADLAGRWSGAALLVDPAAIDSAGRGLRDAAVAGALARRGLLERAEAARSALGAAIRAAAAP